MAAVLERRLAAEKILKTAGPKVAAAAGLATAYAAVEAICSSNASLPTAHLAVAAAAATAEVFCLYLLRPLYLQYWDLGALSVFFFV
jgi:hypothetical protein